MYELYIFVPLSILTFHRPCCVSLCEANFSSRYIDTSWLNLACSLSVTASSFIMSLHSVTCCICIHLTPIYHITLYIHIRYFYIERITITPEKIIGINKWHIRDQEPIVRSDLLSYFIHTIYTSDVKNLNTHQTYTVRKIVLKL